MERDFSRTLGAALLVLVAAVPTAAGADEERTEAAPAAVACQTAPAGMACVPGGSFRRGSDDGPEDTRPAQDVWVQTFYMDTYEVTFADYQDCVRAHKCPRSRPHYRDFSRPRQPMVGVSWFDAVAYCEAMGKHLPTEAEWEKAARGTDGRLYPWGNEPATCELAVIKDETGRSCGVKKRGGRPNKGRTWEVGQKPPGIYGLYDMAGNSWEWVYDWYSKSYGKCGEACAGPDPRGPCDGAERCPGHRFRVVRGGSWYWDASYATTIYRRRHWPANEPYHHFGFRCAANPEEAEKLRKP